MCFLLLCLMGHCAACLPPQQNTVSQRGNHRDSGNWHFHRQTLAMRAMTPGNIFYVWLNEKHKPFGTIHEGHRHLVLATFLSKWQLIVSVSCSPSRSAQFHFPSNPGQERLPPFNFSHQNRGSWFNISFAAPHPHSDKMQPQEFFENKIQIFMSKGSKLRVLPIILKAVLLK